MRVNHKYKSLLVFGPIAVTLLNGLIASYSFFQWGYDNKNEISITLFLVSGINSLVVFGLSLKDKQKIWLVISVIVSILAFLAAYIINSLSNFGF